MYFTYEIVSLSFLFLGLWHCSSFSAFCFVIYFLFFLVFPSPLLKSLKVPFLGLNPAFAKVFAFLAVLCFFSDTILPRLFNNKSFFSKPPVVAFAVSFHTCLLLPVDNIVYTIQRLYFCCVWLHMVVYGCSSLCCGSFWSFYFSFPSRIQISPSLRKIHDVEGAFLS